MRKALITAILALWFLVTNAPAATQTNVLQNINVQLTMHQQGPVTSAGRKMADKPAAYSTKNLITALEAVSGVNFGTGAKLVQSTVYYGLTITNGTPTYTNIFSTNIAASGADLTIGGLLLLGDNFEGVPIVISNNNLSTGGSVTTNVLLVNDTSATNSITFNTNIGFLTTITVSTNNSEPYNITNVQVALQQQTGGVSTTNIFTNDPPQIAVLFGGTANLLYPVSSNIVFSLQSPEIVTASGIGLDTVTPAITSESDIGIKGLEINYYQTNGATNLTLTLNGFAKQTLKIDTLSTGRAPKVAADLYGSAATWSVFGSGSTGGTFTTNQTPVRVLDGYLTNATPVVVQGTVSISFLKNLPQ